MSSWARKVRGILGLSAVGGVIGGLYGAVRLGLMAIFGSGTFIMEGLLLGMATYATFAAIATGGVGLLLATAGSRLSLEELSPLRAGIVGGLLGAAAPVLFVLATWSGGVAAPALVSVALRFGVLGGILGGGLVAVAKRADPALPGSGDDSFLLGKD